VNQQIEVICSVTSTTTLCKVQKLYFELHLILLCSCHAYVPELFRHHSLVQTVASMFWGVDYVVNIGFVVSILVFSKKN